MSYMEMCVTGTMTVRDAMRKLDQTPRKILFVTEGTHLLGTLTDGDVRRFLINGGQLDDEARRAANCHPRFAYDEEQAAALYHEKNYIAIPIVDEAMALKGVYIGTPARQREKAALHIPVVINAGGRGTRLDPFTRVLPKPLIPVGELPIIEQIMQEYNKFGCDDFHVIVNYKKQLIKAYFNESENQYRVTWYDEEKPLGTGGGLTLLKGRLNSTFFFTNCDILLQSNYDSMLRFHRENRNAVTMVCAYKNITIPYGVIEMGKNGCINAMREKPELSFLTNTGVYLVEPEVLDDMADGVSIGFPDVVAMQQAKGRKVAVYPISENEWMDMGQVPELEKMREKLYGE